MTRLTQWGLKPSKNSKHSENHAFRGQNAAPWLTSFFNINHNPRRTPARTLFGAPRLPTTKFFHDGLVRRNEKQWQLCNVNTFQILTSVYDPSDSLGS